MLLTGCLDNAAPTQSVAASALRKRCNMINEQGDETAFSSGGQLTNEEGQ